MLKSTWDQIYCYNCWYKGLQNWQEVAFCCVKSQKRLESTIELKVGKKLLGEFAEN